jgi:5'-3' exoribonuclease 1
VYKEIDTPIDTLALDMNGIFHTAAQKIYKYGNYKPKFKKLLSTRTVHPSVLERKMFKEVCDIVDYLVKFIQPRKKLIISVDGVAGAAKMCQQRQRRYRSAKDNVNVSFDSCSITPGTMLMHKLDLYLQKHIRSQMYSSWKHLTVIYSSEKVPGEGEHTCVKHFKQGDPEDTCCIFGLDADLIMLCLATQLPNIYVLRENLYDYGIIDGKKVTEYHLINIGQFSNKLKEELKTSSAVTDFIFMCFMVGNDFLPRIPTLEIMRGGIDYLLETYKKTCWPLGLTTKEYDIDTTQLRAYLAELCMTEEENLKKKWIERHNYFPDKLLNSHLDIDPCFTDVTVKWNVSFDTYKRDYYTTKVNNPNKTDICHEYLTGLKWVLHYYLIGIPDWTWSFPSSYAPFLSDIAQSVTSWKQYDWPTTQPYNSFQQLLAVLPPQSNQLIPYPLNKLLTDVNCPLAKYYPETVDVDLSGKRREWEGVVCLPMVDLDELTGIYETMIDNVSSVDRIRNEFGRDRTYRYKQR